MAVEEPLDVVLVAFGFPPAFGPGVARPLSWANHLASRGHRVRVLTATLASQERGGVMRSPAPIRLDHRVEVVSLPALGVDVFAQATSKIRMRRLFDAFSSAEAGWGASVAAWLVRHVNPRTIVISTYTPSAALLSTLAARLARSFVWVADYRDPWILRDNPMPSRLHLELAAHLDRKVHQLADGVTYTSYIDMMNAVRAYGVLQGRSLVVRNGIESGSFDVAGIANPAPTILYAGNLYAAPENSSGGLSRFERFYSRRIPYDYSTYSLVPLFRAVAAARNISGRDIRVRTVGSVPRSVVARALTMAAQDPAADWVDVRGVVDKSKVVQMVREAAVVYLPVASRRDGHPSGWVPQKVFELLAGDRPILTTARPGEARTILRTRPGVFFLDENSSGQDAVLAALEHVPARPSGDRPFRRLSQAMQVEAFARRLRGVTSLRSSDNR